VDVAQDRRSTEVADGTAAADPLRAEIDRLKGELAAARARIAELEARADSAG